MLYKSLFSPIFPRVKMSSLFSWISPINFPLPVTIWRCWYHHTFQVFALIYLHSLTNSNLFIIFRQRKTCNLLWPTDRRAKVNIFWLLSLRGAHSTRTTLLWTQGSRFPFRLHLTLGQSAFLFFCSLLYSAWLAVCNANNEERNDLERGECPNKIVRQGGVWTSLCLHWSDS